MNGPAVISMNLVLFFFVNVPRALNATVPPVGTALGPLLIMVVLVAAALGVTVGSRMRTFEGFGVISNFVVLPLYFLSGGVFPPEGLPPWMRVLVVGNPVSYGVDLMRAAIDQPHAFSAALDVGVQAAFAAAMCGAAFTAFRRAAG